jgi:RNA polymerase sigma-70 factor (ECF subfamily)
MTLQTLFERTYPALVRFLYRRLGDRDLAEDVAQEAFVRLLDQEPDRPEAWLFTVADNLARDHTRGRLRRARRLTVLAGEAPTSTAPEVERRLASEEICHDVRTALAGLSERDRTLLLMHQEGVAYRELAEVVGVSPSSIAPLLARARTRFLRALNRAFTADAYADPASRRA